jgi:hypothetical protein
MPGRVLTEGGCTIGSPYELASVIVSTRTGKSRVRVKLPLEAPIVAARQGTPARLVSFKLTIETPTAASFHADATNEALISSAITSLFLLSSLWSWNKSL